MTADTICISTQTTSAKLLPGRRSGSPLKVVNTTTMNINKNNQLSNSLNYKPNKKQNVSFNQSHQTTTNRHSSINMQLNYAPCHYVYSKLTLYYASMLDLRWSRSIHSCDDCLLQQDISSSSHSTSHSGVVCNAVHYGQCTPYKGGLIKRVPVRATSPKKTGRVVRAITTQNVKLSLHKDRDGHQLPNNADSLPKRGDPDGQSDTFLRQKEAQLREKREREKEKKDPKEWQINNSSNSNNKNSLTVLSKEENSNSSNINKTNSHHSDINTNGNVVKTSKSQPHLHKLRTASSTNGTHSSSSPTKLSKGDTDSAHGRKSASAIAEQYKNVHIPQFYFPKGHPGDGLGGRSNTEDVLNKIKEAYAKIEGGKATKENLGPVTKACGLPSYMKSVMFKQFGGEKHGHLTLQQFLAQWRKLCNTCLDDASQFVNLLAKPGVTFLLDEDFVTLVQDVVEGHPGLTFLQEAPEFHSRYVQTVISRILYCVNRSWTGKITVQELRRSNLIQTLRLLDEEEDINQITDFFSYEHFYVIYCKFWELDKDHDLFISPEDLGRHNDHAISSKMIERIFSGAVTRNLKEGKMSYKDFVWFLISEEDKRNPTSIEYWFRCMDLDGDGVISMYEMNYFYKEQVDKMEQLGIETLPFEDTLCQMLDMIKPAVKNRITLGDLKACKLTPIFFDTFFNLDKYLEHEQKDPFANARDLEDGEPEMSDWERYAADEYELLVAEEGANENVDELVYEDDFEAEEDEIPANSGPGQEPAVGDGFTTNTKHQARPNAPSPDEDIYDFTPKDLGY